MSTKKIKFKAVKRKIKNWKREKREKKLIKKLTVTDFVVPFKVIIKNRNKHKGCGGTGR
jgi:hypothetical protein